MCCFKVWHSQLFLLKIITVLRLLLFQRFCLMTYLPNLKVRMKANSACIKKYKNRKLGVWVLTLEGVLSLHFRSAWILQAGDNCSHIAHLQVCLCGVCGLVLRRVLPMRHLFFIYLSFLCQSPHTRSGIELCFQSRRTQTNQKQQFLARNDFEQELGEKSCFFDVGSFPLLADWHKVFVLELKW